MGRYIDWEEIAGRYPDVARIAGATGTGSYWLGYAESEVDARLAVRFTTPFSPAPDVVRDLCIDLTYYKMTMRQKNSEVIREDIEARFEALVNGTMALPTSYTVVADTLMWSEESQSGYHTAFGPDDPLNWIPSSAHMLDTEYERGRY
jgi:hypothetical protein